MYVCMHVFVSVNVYLYREGEIDTQKLVLEGLSHAMVALDDWRTREALMLESQVQRLLKGWAPCFSGDLKFSFLKAPH